MTSSARQNRFPVLLQHPTARLLVYSNLLEGSPDCVVSMVRTAQKLRIIPETSLNDLRLPPSQLICGSMFAAKKILEKHIRHSRLNLDDEAAVQLIEKTWRDVEKDVAQYVAETAMKHTRQYSDVSDVVECGRMAPVVLDILLQHLSRLP